MNFFKSSDSGHQRHLRQIAVGMSFVIGLMIFSNNTGLNMYDSAPQQATARETWLQCIHDIQDHTMNSLADVFSREKLHTPPLLYIDPAYMDNAGDNFIVYGSLVFMERMGFRNHTECNVLSSNGFIILFSHVWTGCRSLKDVTGKKTAEGILKEQKAQITVCKTPHILK